MRVDLVERALDLARHAAAAAAGGARGRGAAGAAARPPRAGGRRASTTPARLLRLSEQDRLSWDAGAITEADALVVAALRAGPPGRFTLQAAIAALHAQAPSYEETDWPQLLELYDALLRVWPSPVVALNRAVVVAMVDGEEAALEEVEALERDGRLASIAISRRRRPICCGASAVTRRRARPTAPRWR